MHCQGGIMPIVEWGDEYVLGIEELDNHHKWLISLLNKSYDAYKSAVSAESLATVLKELIDYSTYHFEAEEYWMVKHSYPKLAEHKVEHDRFSEKVIALQNQFSRNAASLSVKLFLFLANWLRTHILELDADYGRFYAEKVCAEQ